MGRQNPIVVNFLYMSEQLEEQKATGMCPHGNFSNQCPHCREVQFDVLNNWLQALQDKEKVLARDTWNQILDSVSRGDDKLARRLIDELDLEIPVSNDDLLNLARSTALTVAGFWSNAEAAEGYSEAASADDGSLMQLDSLIERRPDFFELQAGDRVLELGSGTGLAIRKIKDHFAESVQIFGSDISRAMYENNLEKDSYDAFEIGDLAKGLPEAYKEKDFELVLASGVFQYLRPEALEKIFSQLAEVSSDDARIIFSIGSMEGFGAWNSHAEIDDSDSQPVGIVVQDLGVPMYYYTDEFIDQLLKKSGFVIESDKKYTLSQIGKSLEESQPSRFIVARMAKNSES